LGLAIGELNTGEIIFGFGGSTIATGSGFTSGGFTMVCFTGVGFTGGGGGCGFQASITGAAIGVVQ